MVIAGSDTALAVSEWLSLFLFEERGAEKPPLSLSPFKFPSFRPSLWLGRNLFLIIRRKWPGNPSTCELRNEDRWAISGGKKLYFIFYDMSFLLFSLKGDWPLRAILSPPTRAQNREGTANYGSQVKNSKTGIENCLFKIRGICVVNIICDSDEYGRVIHRPASWGTKTAERYLETKNWNLVTVFAQEWLTVAQQFWAQRKGLKIGKEPRTTARGWRIT